MDKHAPLITRNISYKHNVPWIDTEFRNNRTKCRKLEKKWRKNKTDENRINYVNQRKLCAEMSIMKQRVYYSKIVEASCNNQKSLFKVVDNLLDKNKVRTLPEHTDPLQLANDFNEYYIEKVNNLRKSIPSDCENKEIPTEVFEGEKLDAFRITTEEELKEIITEFGVKTSTEDPIPADMLKSIINEALPCLTKLVNKSLIEGSMDGVKQSVIDPLLKKSGFDTHTKKNYRPVNNLVFVSKLVERVILKRLNIQWVTQ